MGKARNTIYGSASTKTTDPRKAIEDAHIEVTCDCGGWNGSHVLNDEDAGAVLAALEAAGFAVVAKADIAAKDKRIAALEVEVMADDALFHP
jgi:hypothetical protein